MNILITGHRKHKLAGYDEEFIKLATYNVLATIKDTQVYMRGYAGMASGVDLWFCENCIALNIDYTACIPFDGQEDTMDEDDKLMREVCLKHAKSKMKVKNSWMVEQADLGIVVWDGNKGGTHNVFQQLVEKKKNIVWINPVAEKIWPCIVEKTLDLSAITS